MTSLRKATFRDSMQVTRERIAQLESSELDELMDALLHAQAQRCGLPGTGIQNYRCGDAEGGGCDSWTDAPNGGDEWLGDNATWWQFKAGNDSQPNRLETAISKVIRTRIEKESTRFVLVASGSKDGRDGEDDRLEALARAVQGKRASDGRIEVIGSERLTAWCNQNPAVAVRWTDRPGGPETLANWKKDKEHQIAWQASNFAKDRIKAQHAQLDFDNGSIQHLHIQGLPGVGKTRYALELCREAPWSGSVVYFRQSADLHSGELLADAVAYPDVQLVAVVDEVQHEQLQPLRDLIDRSRGRIRLITVGNCESPDIGRIPAHEVDAQQPEAVERIVADLHPSMPRERVTAVADFAEGYICLARLAGKLVAENPKVKVSKLLDCRDIGGLLDRLLGKVDRTALHALAVLDSVGWKGDAKNEAKAVARHFGLDWSEMRDRVERFHEELGIAPNGGSHRFVSPDPLCNYLAFEASRIRKDKFWTIPDVLPRERAREAYYRRLQSMAAAPQLGSFGRQELSRFRSLNDFREPAAVRRWKSLAASNTAFAATQLREVLERAGPQEIGIFEGASRREVVNALAEFAWSHVGFPEAALALALLAGAENETRDNPATEAFLGKFKITSAGTSVPYLKRLNVIERLVDTNRHELIYLAQRALGKSREPGFSREELGLPLNRHETASEEDFDMEWRPETRTEYAKCIQAAMQQMEAITRKSGVADLVGQALVKKTSNAPAAHGPIRATLNAFSELSPISWSEHQKRHERIRKIFEVGPNEKQEVRDVLAKFEKLFETLTFPEHWDGFPAVPIWLGCRLTGAEAGGSHGVLEISYNLDWTARDYDAGGAGANRLPAGATSPPALLNFGHQRFTHQAHLVSLFGLAELVASGSQTLLRTIEAGLDVFERGRSFSKTDDIGEPFRPEIRKNDFDDSVLRDLLCVKVAAAISIASARMQEDQGKITWEELFSRANSVRRAHDSRVFVFANFLTMADDATSVLNHRGGNRESVGGPKVAIALDPTVFRQYSGSEQEPEVWSRLGELAMKAESKERSTGIAAFAMKASDAEVGMPWDQEGGTWGLQTSLFPGETNFGNPYRSTFVEHLLGKLDLESRKGNSGERMRTFLRSTIIDLAEGDELRHDVFTGFRSVKTEGVAVMYENQEENVRSWLGADPLARIVFIHLGGPSKTENR